MSDIVERLRRITGMAHESWLPTKLGWEAADEIERLQGENRKLLLAMVRIDYAAKCDWCADIAKSVLPDVRLQDENERLKADKVILAEDNARLRTELARANDPTWPRDDPTFDRDFAELQANRFKLRADVQSVSPELTCPKTGAECESVMTCIGFKGCWLLGDDV